MKLKIINETKWSTADLRKFILAALKEVTGGWKGTYTVIVKNHFGRNLGYGRYHQQWMIIRFPTAKKDDVCPIDWLKQTVHVIDHEYDHNRGLEHREMISRYVRYDKDVSWVDRFVEAGNSIRSTIKAKPVVDKQAKRAEHAKKMLAEHEAKLKREQKLVRKWKQKVKYYEKAIANRDPNYLEKLAAARAARAARPAFSPKRETLRLAEEQGVNITDDTDVTWMEYKILLSLPGQSKHWIHEDCVEHEHSCTGWRDAYKYLKNAQYENCDVENNEDCKWYENATKGRKS